MLNTRLLKSLALGFATGCLLLAGAGSTQAAESDDPIKIILNDWSSQLVTSYIVGGMFERKGYNVEYVQADAMAQFAGLETGDLHIQVEIWPTTQWDRFMSSVDSGNVLNLGKSGVNAREEWWYPAYMTEQCPSLPDWRALLEPDCAKAFSNVETAPKGRYLGAPVSWEGFDEERVEALGLPFEVIHAGSDIALVGEIQSAYKRKAPILAWFWVPHWWPAEMEGDFISFPDYEPECYQNPGWGTNAQKAYDCGKPFGILHKAAWAGGASMWPAAYEAFGNLKIDDKTASEFFYAGEIEAREPKDVAESWLNANEAAWSAWW